MGRSSREPHRVSHPLAGVAAEATSHFSLEERLNRTRGDARPAAFALKAAGSFFSTGHSAQ
jgi:hypothetical protein